MNGSVEKHRLHPFHQELNEKRENDDETRQPCVYTKCRTVLCLCLVIFGFIYGISSFYNNFTMYLSYPIQTQVLMVQETDSIFPSVTICNRNMFMRSKAEKKYPKLVEYYDMKISSKDVNISSEEMEHIFEDIGHSVNETIIGCHWAKDLCSLKNVTTVMVQDHGLCFTFNSGKAGHPLLKVPVSGPFFSLRLELNVQQNDNLDSDDSGFNLVLHDQEESPDSIGLSLRPGASTIIAVEKNKSKRLPAPYGTNCVSRETPEYKNYTKPACISDCFYQYIVKKCGCKKEGLLGPAKACSFFDRVNCATEAEKSFHLNEENKCSCPLACETLTYRRQVSYASYPSKKAARELEKSLRKPSMSDAEYDMYLRENMVRVEIFYERLNYQVSQETPLMTFADLLGTLGALVCLFLGCFFLIVIENPGRMCCTSRKQKAKELPVV